MPILTGNRCQCAACGEFFNSEKGFNGHRKGPPNNRSCLTKMQMQAKGWSKNARGFWITERRIGAAIPQEATIATPPATYPQGVSV
jgi:hypothetical protein